jgi:transposase-like protein
MVVKGRTKVQLGATKMKAKRRRHEAAFKSRVAIEAVKGIKTIQQIAKEYDVHPVQVSDWKKRMLECLPGVFEAGATGSAEADFEKERDELRSKIGELTIKLDFVIKKSKQLGL